MNKLFRKIFDIYRNMKLQPKFMVSHLILVLVPTVVITYFLYGEMQDIIISYTIQQEQTMSAQTRDSIDTVLEQVQKTSNSVVDNDYFQSLLQSRRTEDYDALLDPNQTTAFFYSVSSLIDHNLISDIKIYGDLPNPAFYQSSGSKHSVFLPFNEAKGSYWYGILSSRPTPTLYCPSFYLSTYELDNYGDMAIITSKTFIVDGEVMPVYVCVYFSQSKINTILEQSTSKNNTITYVINERDTLVGTSDSIQLGTHIMSYENVRNSFKDSSGFVNKTILGNQYYTGIFSIPATNWYLVSMLPAKPLLEQANTIVFKFIAIYLLFLACAFLIASLFSRSLTRRISSLIHQMETVRSGRPLSMDAPAIQDEIGDLTDTYNFMSGQMNRLLDHQAEAAEHLRISEFKALQSQINPHFLYNTLDMINWLAKTGQEEKVTKAVQALSKFYKLTLNKGNIAISLKEEITQVSLYVQLQNMRYQDQINFLVDIPDELLDYEIPKLILQPIVENSINHGIFGKEEKEGTIVITGWPEGDLLILLVSDDGVGISTEKQKTILTGDGESQTGSNIGIYNTHARLQLFYGDRKYGLQYHSHPGIGTEVEIRIPAKKYQLGQLGT